MCPLPETDSCRTDFDHAASADMCSVCRVSPSNLEILFYEETPLGVLCLRRRRLLDGTGTVVTEVTLNHEFLMSSYNTGSERVLTCKALEMHQGKNLKVLVGGLGLGYTAYEALQNDRVQSVEVIELLPQVISWIEQDLIPLAQNLKGNPRLRVIQDDIYKKLLSPPKEPWDLILIDVDHSPHEQLHETNSRFYAREGLALAKAHLAPGGVLGVWSYAESSPFAEALRSEFSKVLIHPVPFKNTLVNEDHTDWLFFACD